MESSLCCDLLYPAKDLLCHVYFFSKLSENSEFFPYENHKNACKTPPKPHGVAFIN